MPPEIALLHNNLIIGAILFGIGLIGFLSRRNMIILFLAVEMMLQGVSLSLIGWSRYHNNFDGQFLVIFIVAIAACEAAIALAIIMVLFHRSGKLDIADWQQLREANQPPFIDEPLPPAPRIDETWPQLTPAGVAPPIPHEKTDFRPKV